MRRAASGIRAITLSTCMFAVSAWWSPLRGQSDGTEAVADMRARTAIQQTLRNTAAKGVPIDPLVRKVREGLSKQSDPERISSAVQTLAKRLEVSYSALAPTFSVAELSAGADALDVGVSASTLRELRKIWKAKPLTVPLGILYELVSREIPVSLASKRVSELMYRGANDAQLAGLSAKVINDVAAGIKPGAALELRTKGVMSLLTTPIGTATVVPTKPPIRPR